LCLRCGTKKNGHKHWLVKGFGVSIQKSNNIVIWLNQKQWQDPY
jgi:hypothetical protein